MEYSDHISNLVKEINLIIHKDSSIDPNKRELLTKTLESFTPFISNTLQGNDISSDDRSKLISNINDYIKEKLVKYIENSLNEISDYLCIDNLGNYSVEGIDSFRKELDKLIENYIYT